MLFEEFSRFQIPVSHPVAFTGGLLIVTVDLAENTVFRLLQLSRTPIKTGLLSVIGMEYPSRTWFTPGVLENLFDLSQLNPEDALTSLARSSSLVSSVIVPQLSLQAIIKVVLLKNIGHFVSNQLPISNIDVLSLTNE